ncbi:unnamed protein product [Periconia digitata]|uniref:BTB domain-containing protein n=1 Tax=Periconia digitata TaxID=1303443 RepID=A0A9W4U5W9_9PLEO|nr:unnamed protein product [Periconia digitata]
MDNPFCNGPSMSPNSTDFRTSIMDNPFGNGPSMSPNSTDFPTGEMLHDPREALESGIKSLYLPEKYSDFTIVCGDDVFPVHKAIICPRSDYFAAAVKFGKEASENKIVLSEDEPAIVKLMIQYFYKLNYKLDEPAHVPADPLPWAPAAYLYVVPVFGYLGNSTRDEDKILRPKIIEMLISISTAGMSRALDFAQNLPWKERVSVIHP